MTSTGPLGRRDIVLVAFPFTDLSSTKIRPALILAGTNSNEYIVAFIGSRTGPHDPFTEYMFDPPDADFAATGLKQRSVVRLDKLATLHRTLIRRRIGRISESMEHAIHERLRQVFGM